MLNANRQAEGSSGLRMVCHTSVSLHSLVSNVTVNPVESTHS